MLRKLVVWSTQLELKLLKNNKLIQIWKWALKASNELKDATEILKAGLRS